MNYWGATDEYLDEHGSGPPCPRCGQTMFPADDHGRFACMCNLGGRLDVRSGFFSEPLSIPQTDTSGMSDADKALVPPIHRLHDAPTAAEKESLNALSAEFGLPANF